MKTEQVIEGIGKAVTATQPAQEYCLFWWDWWPMCMTKAEWSGWMQALGAVAAILALVWQNVHERKNRDREHAAKVRGILERSVSALNDLGHYCDTSGLMMASLADGEFSTRAVVQLQATLSTSAMQLERLPFWELPDSGLAIELQNVLRALSMLRTVIDHAPHDAPRMLDYLSLTSRDAQTVFIMQLENS